MVATTRSRSTPSRACPFPIKQEHEIGEANTRSTKQEITENGSERATSARLSKKKEMEEECGMVTRRSVRQAMLEKDYAGLSRRGDKDEEEKDYEEDSDDETQPKNFQQQTPASAPPSQYESLRLQRIAENKTRLAALGVQKHVTSLTSYFQASKPMKRPWRKSPVTPIELRRRSDRLKDIGTAPGFYSPFFTKSCVSDAEESPKLQLVLSNRVYRNYHDNDKERRPGNAPLPKNCPTDLQISPALSALRCRSKERGTLYDGIVGICCHFCRQKKLCGEEDCERCGYRDVTKACAGKTDCSRCHSSTGVFCRACLKIRYGEEIEEVRARSDWLCPHCSEEEGLNPYWVCNSSICLARRKIAPTGIAIYKARELGFESVAHYLADILKKEASGKC